MLATIGIVTVLWCLGLVDGRDGGDWSALLGDPDGCDGGEGGDGGGD